MKEGMKKNGEAQRNMCYSSNWGGPKKIGGPPKRVSEITSLGGRP